LSSLELQLIVGMFYCWLHGNIQKSGRVIPQQYKLMHCRNYYQDGRSLAKTFYTNLHAWFV